MSIHFTDRVAAAAGFGHAGGLAAAPGSGVVLLEQCGVAGTYFGVSGILGSNIMMLTVNHFVNAWEYHRHAKPAVLNLCNAGSASSAGSYISK